MLEVALFTQDDGLACRLRHAFKSMTARVERYAVLPHDSVPWRSHKCDVLVVHPALSVMDLASSWGRESRWAPSPAMVALMPDHHMAFAPALLDAGFDRCLPVSLDDVSLCAVVRALTRRKQGMTVSVSHYGPLSFNHVTQQAHVRDVAIDLTSREAQALEILLKRVGQIIPKERFVEDMEPNSMTLNTTAAEVYIHRLRKKISHDILPIRNIKRCGYLLPRYAHPSEGHRINLTKERILPLESTCANTMSPDATFSPMNS